MHESTVARCMHSIVVGFSFSSLLKVDKSVLRLSHFTINTYWPEVELLSKELNHLAAILQHYAGSLIFMK
jgi:hypothetical protein